jgi:hypothetical protein
MPIHKTPRVRVMQGEAVTNRCRLTKASTLGLGPSGWLLCRVSADILSLASFCHCFRHYHDRDRKPYLHRAHPNHITIVPSRLTSTLPCPQRAVARRWILKYSAAPCEGRVHILHLIHPRHLVHPFVICMMAALTATTLAKKTTCLT